MGKIVKFPTEEPSEWVEPSLANQLLVSMLKIPYRVLFPIAWLIWGLAAITGWAYFQLGTIIYRKDLSGIAWDWLGFTFIWKHKE